MHVDPAEVPCAWRCELEVPSWIDPEKSKVLSPDEVLLATTEKKQRTEVKLSVLSSEEQKAFAAAKDAEVQNWIKTGTVSRILRAKLSPEQILRCRWILTWKPLDGKTPDAQARLVVLGYMDPQLRYPGIAPLSIFTGSCFACGISLTLCFIIAQVPKQEKNTWNPVLPN